MCGDGTNDVGALKHAHVGVALITPSSKPKPAAPAAAVSPGSTASTGPVSAGANQPPNTVMIGNRRFNLPPNANPRVQQKMTETQEKMQKLMAEWEQQDAQIVKLGDASIAAPFTSKIPSISSGELV